MAGEWDVLPLANPGDLSEDPRYKNASLKIGADGRAGYAQPPAEPHASLASSGMVKLEKPPAQEAHADLRRGMMSTSKADGSERHPQATRPLSNDELLAKANEMLEGQRSGHEAQLAEGPSVGHNAEQAPPEWLTGYMKEDGG